MSASKRRKKKGRIIIFAIEIILLLAALAALFVWSKYQKLDRQPDMIGTEDIMNEDMDESVQEVLKGYTNIALFALDNRSNGCPVQITRYSYSPLTPPARTRPCLRS